MARALAGEECRLAAWERERLPVLVAALRRWGLGGAEAEDAGWEIVLAAYRAVRRGRCVGSELAWMAGAKIAGVLFFRDGAVSTAFGPRERAVLHPEGKRSPNPAARGSPAGTRSGR